LRIGVVERERPVVRRSGVRFIVIACAVATR